MGKRSGEAARHVLRGAGASTRHNGLAYGYSLATTGAYGILSTSAGSPTPADIMLFGVAGAATFTLAMSSATRGFRRRVRDEPPVVRAIGSSFSFVSIPGTIAVAWLFGWLLPASFAWPVGGFAVSAVYLLLAGLEIALARVLRPVLAAEELADADDAA